jgi:aminoglycoside phosphotransferase (APT) family kinase protein
VVAAVGCCGEPLPLRWGAFGADGIGKYRTWHDCPVSGLDWDWQKITDRIDSSLLDRLAGEFGSLLPSCPEERRFVHGDFGSNNLLWMRAESPAYWTGTTPSMAIRFSTSPARTSGGRG